MNHHIWVNYNTSPTCLGGYSPHKPPFGVRSCEVVITHPDHVLYLDSRHLVPRRHEFSEAHEVLSPLPVPKPGVGDAGHERQGESGGEIVHQHLGRFLSLTKQWSPIANRLDCWFPTKKGLPEKCSVHLGVRSRSQPWLEEGQQRLVDHFRIISEGLEGATRG